MDVSTLTGATDANPANKRCSFCQILTPRYKKRGGQTTSRVFSIWCESQTSDLALAVQTEQERSIGFDRAARCHERGIAHKIDDLARSGDPMPI